MKVSSSKVTTSTAKVDSEIHQASMLFLPWLSSSPRLGVPGGTPRPRKSSEVSARMAALMRNGRKVTTGVSLFGWMGLSDYVRAEFLRNRQLDYVKAARALGVGNWHIIWRHILPNSLTPVVTFLPFRMSAAILALTSLDFLGLGVPPGTPSLGELLSQGKNSIDAWWISLSTFAVLVVTLLLLTFMGDALRDALDPRKADK